MLAAMPAINMAATGANIRDLIKARGLTVSEVQTIYGLNTPQSIYKWMRGEMLPSLDNLVILAYILETTIDKIIITDTTI